jgi:hypothetical protein
MSLRKSPVMTAARLAAHRANALKSTGPKTARGKSWSRLNGLKRGGRSRLFLSFMTTMFCAPPYSVEETAAGILTPEQASHPRYAEMLDLFRDAEMDDEPEFRAPRERWMSPKKTFIQPKLECD